MANPYKYGGDYDLDDNELDILYARSDENRSRERHNRTIRDQSVFEQNTLKNNGSNSVKTRLISQVNNLNVEYNKLLEVNQKLISEINLLRLENKMLTQKNKVEKDKLLSEIKSLTDEIKNIKYPDPIYKDVLCPICKDTCKNLNDLYVSTGCGHLLCLSCYKDYKNCVVCSKPVLSYIKLYS